MTVEVLPSARLRAASENLFEFVRQARDQITAFGADFDFDAPVWNVTAASSKRPTNACRTDRLYFTTSECRQQKSMKGRLLLSEPFASFLKAIVRRRQERKSKKASDHRVVIRAGRYLHDVLQHRAHDPCKLEGADFQAAAARCHQREEPSSRYRLGIALVEIAETMNKYGIAKVPIDFKNPFRRMDHGSRLGTEYEKRRAEKLPPEAALDALSRIANLVTEPADIVRMRAIELLVCGGWRINEVLVLPVDGEVTEPVAKNGEIVLDHSGAPLERYGIRYYAEKGFGPSIKWIPTAMIDVAKRAVADIRRETESARVLARWLEANPGHAFIPPNFGADNPDAFISAADIGIMFGLTRASATQWMRTRKLPMKKVSGRVHIRRGDLETALLAEQPKIDHSGIPLKLSGYLFLVHRHFFNSDRATNPCALELLSDQQIADFLQGRESSRGATLSAFQRFGFTEPDGSPIVLTSHMFRHWLNTLMQQGGMGQHEIARWSGRKDVGHNQAYDHVSAVELAEKARRMMEIGKVRGFVAENHDRLPPVDREEFRNAAFATAHTTDIGMCGNDWSLVPCPMHGSCADCGDHWVEKGNERQCRRAETLLDEHQWLLQRAEAETDEGTYGASNYVEHQRRMVRGLKKIIAVHHDASIAAGTLVQVNPSTPSRFTEKPLDGAAASVSTGGAKHVDPTS